MKNVVMTVEDRGMDYSPIIDYLAEHQLAAKWLPLKKQSAEELLSVVKDADAVIAGVEKWDADILGKCVPRLKIIARYGIGYDSVDIEAARQLGITVTNTPAVLSEAVAELALALYIDLSRAISRRNAELHQGDWGIPDMGHNIFGKTVGIIGFGDIGRRFAELLSPFHCHILAYDPFFDNAIGEKLRVERTDLPRLLRESDCVSLHVPAVSDTIGMVNRSFLEQMRQTAFLINTSRGSLLDEQALADALNEGMIAGAALDVYSREPLPSRNILKGIPNLVMTPHIGSATEESFLAAGLLAAESVVDVLEGRTPKHCL